MTRHPQWKTCPQGAVIGDDVASPKVLRAAQAAVAPSPSRTQDLWVGKSVSSVSGDSSGSGQACFGAAGNCSLDVELDDSPACPQFSASASSGWHSAVSYSIDAGKGSGARFAAS
mmetsp:Transcript_49075/g.129528  ORF Transcript_49075/g.129528 Transcript_49075/m.129528 type:complete len:115 (-) Transcript_49075:271-615(-)